MTAVFDQIAEHYDGGFSFALVGRHQRQRVWGYLDKQIFITDKKLKVLELNCGTGIDAIHISNKGHKVIATDISEAMLDQAKKNAINIAINTIEFVQLDITQLAERNLGKFDLVFSNFGGFNCLSPNQLMSFSNYLPKILNEDGRVIMVLMPRFTMLEFIFCLMKLKISRLIKRWNGKMKVRVGSDSIMTYYYNKSKIARVFKNGIIKNLTPVGFIPSFLNSYFEKHDKRFEKINKFENEAYKYGTYVNFADHYLVDILYNKNKNS